MTTMWNEESQGPSQSPNIASSAPEMLSQGSDTSLQSSSVGGCDPECKGYALFIAYRAILEFFKRDFFDYDPLCESFTKLQNSVIIRS